MSNFETWWGREGQEFLYALNTTTDDDIKLVAEVAWKNGAYCAEQAEQEPVLCVECGKPTMHIGNKCYACCQKDTKDLEDALKSWDAVPVQQAEQEPVAWQGAEEWEPLAFQLCADENGEESCNELLWDGGVIPEPWGERWLKYEDEAKRMIEYVRKYAAPVRTKDLTDDEIVAVATSCWFLDGTTVAKLNFARDVIAADREKNRGAA